MEMPQTSCLKTNIEGEILDPGVYFKVINHELRKQILHKLFRMTLKGPIQKKELAKALNIGYHRLLYQLNEHLREFWKVEKERKIRGAREEWISPSSPHAIYCNLGHDAAINMIDPLANLFGRLSKVGTRCDECPREQQNSCMESIREQKCAIEYLKSEGDRNNIFLANNRTEPYTPVDYVLICTLTRAMDGDKCILDSEKLKCTLH